MAKTNIKTEEKKNINICDCKELLKELIDDVEDEKLIDKLIIELLIDFIKKRPPHIRKKFLEKIGERKLRTKEV